MAARENLARVGEMRTDGVREWAARVGLTPDDLACIQPTYPCPADTAQIVTLTTLALTLLAAFGCAGNGARLLWRAFRSHSGAVVPMLWWLAGVVGVPMLTVAIGAHGTPPMCLPLPIATLLLAAGVYGTYTLFLLSAPLLIAVGVRARLRRN